MIFTPVFVEKALGDSNAQAVEAEHGGLARDPRLTEYVTFIGSQLSPFAKRKDIKHTFKVLETREIPNAFALGNGNVYVTRGLLNMLDNEAQLAEVIGHEIGHVDNRHIASHIDRAIGVTGLLALAEGIYAVNRGGKVSEDSQAKMDMANQVIPALILSGFGREQELESDSDGLKYMVKAGYDPMAAAQVFEKFQALEGDVPAIDVFFRSHPLAKDRVSDLQKRIMAKYPSVKGELHTNRFQSIVNGHSTIHSYSGGILGVSTPVAIAVGAALAISAGVVIASLR